METELVKMSNQLVRSRFIPKTVYEMRLIVQFAKRICEDDADFVEYSFHRSAIFSGEDLRGGETSRILDETTDNVMGKVIKQAKGSGWSKSNLFYRIDYDPKKGLVIGTLHPDVKDLFIGVKKYFLLIDETEFNKLRSVYSQRIFLYMESYKSIGKATFALSELHDFLGSPKTYRSNFSLFRKRILDVVKKEINEKTSLNLNIIEDTKGAKKKVVEVVFVTGGMASAVEDTLKQRDLEKEADRNNKIFLKMMACYGKKQGKCKEELGENYCSVCRTANGVQLDLPM